MPHGNAFTLVEILIVVVIIGILAAIVIPKFSDASNDARLASFEVNLRQLVKAATMYHEKYGALPSQAAGAPVPLELFEMLPAAGKFPLTTPLGGFWHIGHFTDVDRWGVGVWWPGDEQGTEDRVLEVDNEIDDGNGASGRFQIRDNARYYWLID